MKYLNQVILVSTFGIASTSVWAIDPYVIEVGVFNLVPTMNVDLSHNDNIFLTNRNEVSSYIGVIEPKVQAILQSNSNQYLLEAEVIDGEYSASSDDDYTDWRIGGTAHIELNARNILDFDTSYFSTHEERGTGFSEGGNLPEAPEEYDDTNFGLSYQFGTIESSGRIVLDASYDEREYTTNRTVTEFRDREATNYGAIFYLNVLANADLLFEYIYSDINYLTDPAIITGLGSLDSEENYGYVGISWEFTAQTTGTVKLGYVEKNFASPLREDAENPSWDVDIQWQPLSYSTFGISARSYFDEANGIGDSIEREDYGVNWQHEWSDRLSSELSTNFNDSVYSGSTRKDTQHFYTARLNYSYARWLDINFQLQLDDRDSNISSFDYSRSIVSIGFEASL